MHQRSPKRSGRSTSFLLRKHRRLNGDLFKLVRCVVPLHCGGLHTEFDSLIQTGGLDIPIDLSPVKANDAIPPRSNSRMGSAFGPFSQMGRR